MPRPLTDSEKALVDDAYQRFAGGEYDSPDDLMDGYQRYLSER